jgi:hypothetical protein
MRNRVIGKCDAAIYEIQSHLKDITKVLITLDAWSSRSNRYSYLATKAYWIDADWNYHEELIDFGDVSAGHSGAQLTYEVERIVALYSLHSRVFTLTTDNASSNKKMHKEM